MTSFKIYNPKDLFGEASLTRQLGLGKGVKINPETNWVELSINKRVVVMPLQPLLRSVTWKDLNTHELVGGLKTAFSGYTTGVRTYKVRLPSTAEMAVFLEALIPHFSLGSLGVDYNSLGPWCHTSTSLPEEPHKKWWWVVTVVTGFTTTKKPLV